MAISNGTAQVIGQALPTPPYANDNTGGAIPPLQQNNSVMPEEYRKYLQSSSMPDINMLPVMADLFRAGQNNDNARNQMYANLLWNTYRNTGNNATMPVVGNQLREAIDRGNFNPILR